jgi:hypothetical protein
MTAGNKKTFLSEGFGLFPSGAILNQLARNAAPSRKDRFGMSFSFFIE